MQKYSLNNDASDVTSVGEFDIILPKYQCDNCGQAISEHYFDETGECASCRRDNNVTEGLERIYTVSIYLPDEDRMQNGVVGDISKFSDSIYKAKGGEYISEMSSILKKGFQEFDDLTNSELIVYPPSGEGGNNHMKKIANRVGEKINIDSADLMVKSENYKSQKSTESIKERKSNLDGKISISNSGTSGINLSETDRVVIVDDVVVTGSTMSNTAQVLKEHGVGEVYGLAIARNERLEHIVEYADLIEQE